jgi:two-component system KDP operon response regulator KdpE
MKVLLADDDPQMVRALSITLRARGYEVTAAHDGVEALARASDDHPDIVVLDLGMPGLTGIEVITAIRGWSTMPILVISGRTESWDKVKALDAGADDYITKPFVIDELLARIRALTRRTAVTPIESSFVRFGDAEIDLSGRLATRNGTPIRLTPTEWRILETLLRHPRSLVTRETLLTAVWGPTFHTDPSYLRLYLSQLRKKLEPVPAEPRYLLTEAGMGYRFVPDDPK